ncbi:MotA/TolQ/ExbB proton channel family protein [Shewanella pealeana]|uniref:MotA/TolQ/ExbB proton channel n=1 Tax=Shewanella pealeana (strain ATCC 700345 / ANG-SQ1) TaxID=398579 RepID=A8H7V7_SHEPA|nr:MotA/TolQ/ExbB proton channel family protein [Shewanella pealeana]ABV88644.1 MotA/TolQ/ExbB proton channel [Shewanella pealeana ATCC 700345]
MYQPLYQQLIEQLGYLSWPLFICAFLGLMIILERLALLLYELPKRDSWLTQLRQQARSATPEQRQQLMTQISQGRSMLAKGTALLLSHGEQSRAMREEIVSLWLVKQKSKLLSGLKILHIIGVITPLLGLLGTVLGLIEMFNQLGLSDGPVTPSQLASGLGLAMNTTAAGLIIAVPAITMAHLFTLWAERRCNKLAHALNLLNLWLDGFDQALSIGTDSAAQLCSKAATCKEASCQSQAAELNKEAELNKTPLTGLSS